MSYFFKCKDLTNPQIIKAAKQLAKREGCHLEDHFARFVLEACDDTIVMIDRCNEVGLYEFTDSNVFGKKELKVTIKPKKLKYFTTASKTPCEIMLKIAELEENGKFKITADMLGIIQTSFHELYEASTIRQSKAGFVFNSIVTSGQLNKLGRFKEI